MGLDDGVEKHFGNLARIRGVKYYKLSQYEQKAIGEPAGLFNLIPRAWATFPRWFVPLAGGAIVYCFGDWYYKRSKRKNPKDYVNEVDPNPPPKMICTMVTEQVPYCERKDRKVEETREVEICSAAPPELGDKDEKILARKKLRDRLEKKE